jgi:CMP/dCMP kinase
LIIVIDGPAGAGKSTTAKEIARRAGLDYVDSGAMYRGFTYLYLKNGKDRSRLTDLLGDHGLRFGFQSTEAHVFHEETEITSDIRSDSVNDHVSEVAAMEEVRNAVRRLLREVSVNGNVVLEGRDLGTVVFPDADYKFFLTADPEARARRRYDERIGKGEQVSLKQVRENVINRDRIDSTRDIAPLKKADDAVEIDSTSLTFEEQVTRILQHIRSTPTETEHDNVT